MLTTNKNILNEVEKFYFKKKKKNLKTHKTIHHQNLQTPRKKPEPSIIIQKIRHRRRFEIAA